MATKADDDMPVMPYMSVTPHTLPAATKDSSSWPEFDEESVNNPWKQVIEDLIKLINVEEPDSVKADKDGIELAEFLIANAHISVAIDKKKEKLIKKSGVNEVKVTYFKNWGDTRQGLVLYVCPTSISDVERLVQACEHMGIKVSVVNYYLLQHTALG